MSQAGPTTDTPWGTGVDETPEKVTAGLTEKRTCELVECYCVRSCPKRLRILGNRYLELQSWVGSLEADPGTRMCVKGLTRKVSGKTGRGGVRKWEWGRKEARPG